jgi:hypothetical protein
MMKKLFTGRKFIYSIIAAIFIWGIALRAVEVINGNYLFGFDIGRDLLVARSIVEQYKLTLIGAEIGSGSAGINGVFQGPGYYYLLAVVYVLFRGNPYGALLTMFVFGVAGLILVYGTVRNIFDRATAAVALFLTGISPLIVSQSRFIWAPHPATPLIILSLYFSYLIPKRPVLYAPLALLTAGLTYHFEFAMTVPMILAIMIAMLLIYRIRDIKTYLYSFGTLLFVFLPMILFEMRHGWMAVRSFLSYSVSAGPVGGDVWTLRITDHMGPYISSAANSFVYEHGLLPQQAFTLLCGGLLVALIVFSWKTKEKAKRQFFQFLLLLLVTTYISLLFLNNLIWDYYLIHTHFIYMYVFSYLIVISFKRYRILFVVLTIFLVSMIVSSAWRMMISYTYDIKDKGGVEKIYGKKYAIDYVYKDAAGKPFSEFTFMAPIYTYPYDYLFQTYGGQKYGYVPGSVKKGLVYLIIEPDSSKPWTYKGWLETVIVGGTIVKTETLPTGQIVQLRQFP